MLSTPRRRYETHRQSAKFTSCQLPTINHNKHDYISSHQPLPSRLSPSRATPLLQSVFVTTVRLHFTIVIVIAPTIVDRWASRLIGVHHHCLLRFTVHLSARDPDNTTLIFVCHVSTYYLLFSLCIIQQHPHPHDHNIISYPPQPIKHHCHFELKLQIPPMPTPTPPPPTPGMSMNLGCFGSGKSGKSCGKGGKGSGKGGTYIII